MADVIFFFLKQFILVLISVLDLAMLIRALLSWIDPMQDMRLSGFLAMVTEPIILPFRKLCAKNHWFEGSPLDVPFFMAILALMVVDLVVRML